MVDSVTPFPIELLVAFRNVLGDKGVLEQDSDKEPFVKDWRGNFGGDTPVVLRPASTNEVAAVVRLCSEYNVAVTPQGGNTGLVDGGVPHGEVLISLQRMNKIRDVDPFNNSITVDAGIVLTSVHAAALNADRYFPLHLGSQGSAQIGGLIGTNAGGVAVLRYGMMRDLILGLEVVTPTGEILSGLTGLRKDNTGYNLKHLFCGAEGTLGIVTAATLKLFPVPKTATAWLTLSSVSDAVELLSLVRAEVGDMVTGFEFMPRLAVELTAAEIDHVRDPLPSEAPWRVLLELSMSSETMAREMIEHVLEKALETGKVLDGLIAESHSHARDFWSVRESIPLAKRTYMNSVNHDVSVPVSRVPDFLASAEQAVREIIPECDIIAFGHLGDGNIHYSVAERIDPKNSKIRPMMHTIMDCVHGVVGEFNGSISAEHGIGRLKVDELPDYKSETELNLMRAIKKAIDPQNIMNPGRIIRID